MANKQVLLSGGTLPAGGSYNMDLFLAKEFSHKGMIDLIVDLTWATTGSPSGATAKTYNGWGPEDPNAPPFWFVPGGTSVASFDSNGTTVTVPTVGTSSTNQKAQFSVSLDASQLGEWLRLALTNTDASNAATMSIYAII